MLHGGRDQDTWSRILRSLFPRKERKRGSGMIVVFVLIALLGWGLVALTYFIHFKAFPLWVIYALIVYFSVLR